MDELPMIFYKLSPSRSFAERVWGRVFGSKEHRRKLRLVPKDCYYCELLGICRDVNNDWKCIGKCLTDENLHLKKSFISRIKNILRLNKIY